MEIIKDDICKNFICIHYPGVVKNESKALETLGGVRAISSVVYNGNRRLELRMRPNDVFCKPAFATRRSVTALVLKIKVKKKKKEIIKCEVLGHVVEEYRFTSICDFQYNPTSNTESIFYSKVVPTEFDVDWFKGECPFFLQPTTFSRIDTVQSFNFSKVTATEEDRPNVIGILKRKRHGCTKCISFEHPEVPDRPKNFPGGGNWSTKIVSKDQLNILIQLFLERPIYSKAAISSISKFPHDQLKCLLPCVAYFFVNGPWRSLWVRFGYDPRKDPSSRIYQTLDYRAKSKFAKGKKQKAFTKTNANSPLSIRFSNQNASAANKSDETTEKEDQKIERLDHIFKPGMIPTLRQCLYQYCDIHVPEIQAMLDSLPMVEEQEVCNEVHGWLPPGMSESCREIMKKYVEEETRRREELSPSFSKPSNTQDASSQYSESESDSSDAEE